MSKKIIGMLVVTLLIATAVLPVTSAMNKEVKNNDVEPLIHPMLAFLFGTLENKQRGGIGWECNARNLRFFNFEELKYHHYTNSEFLEISRFGLGIFIGKFIYGFYKVMY